MKMKFCTVCEKTSHLVPLPCEHFICFHCLYDKFSMFDNLPQCCGREIKFSALFQYLASCNMLSEFPEFLDVSISFQDRLFCIQQNEPPYIDYLEDEMISFRGVRFRSRRDSILFTNIGHFRMPHRSMILEHFRPHRLSLIKTLQSQLYHIYLVHKNYDMLYTFDELLYQPLEYDKFLVHYLDSGIVFEYECQEVENNNFYTNMYFINFVFVLTHIWNRRSTAYLENHYHGTITSRNGTLRERLQLLNLNAIVTIPNRFKNLRYQSYGNDNYSNNEKLFHNLRLIHFRDLSILEKKYEWRTSFLLLFYKTKLQHINSYDIRREIYSYLCV